MRAARSHRDALIRRTKSQNHRVSSPVPDFKDLMPPLSAQPQHLQAVEPKDQSVASTGARSLSDSVSAREPEKTPSSLALAAFNLYKSYGKRCVVDDVSLHVEKGEVVGLL